MFLRKLFGWFPPALGVAKATLLFGVSSASWGSRLVFTILCYTTILSHSFWYATIAACYWLLHRDIQPGDACVCALLVGAHVSLAIIELCRPYIRRKN